MKKTALALALLLGAAAHGAQAQSIKLGLKLGPTLSNYYGEDKGDSKYLLGINGGVTANFAFSDMLSVQPEVLYSTKGHGYNVSGGGHDRISYIDVPLLLRIDADGPFFELGPQIGFLTKAESKPDNAPAFALNYQKVDVGAVLGLGYQADNGLSLGLRYNPGFVKLLPESSTGNRIYNSAFQLQLGYRFSDL
ncbi:PorT family protein [Hymenobacter sp. 15J16-1T3B]|uniref:porin family protein n=1 Tax=Hymenobacter sp. 15J16-1T3B TaxID=2886941 RepID=UPI001D102A6A|nr:porin family protein [Hymenobacter sp. 15J16-1T3B]MCC3155609.1 PorT family protein [Hymenobacter sp. 15J16-1T3B]